MLAIVASVSAVLAYRFAGQLLSGEGITIDFSVENDDEESTETGSTERTGVEPLVTAR